MAKIKEKKSDPTKLSTKHKCSIVANGCVYAPLGIISNNLIKINKDE